MDKKNNNNKRLIQSLGLRTNFITMHFYWKTTNLTRPKRTVIFRFEICTNEKIIIIDYRFVTLLNIVESFKI